jgi:hypothetical protein
MGEETLITVANKVHFKWFPEALHLSLGPSKIQQRCKICPLNYDTQSKSKVNLLITLHATICNKRKLHHFSTT